MTLANLRARVRAIEPTGTQSIFIPAFGNAYNSVGSSIATIAGSRFPAWQHPDSADSQWNLMWDEEALHIKGWAQYSVALLHGNPNAGTGNVIIDATSSVQAVGGTLTAGDVALATGAAVAAGAQNVLTSYTLAASLTVTAGSLRHVRLMRHGGDVGDTLAGVWNCLGYRLTRIN